MADNAGVDSLFDPLYEDRQRGLKKKYERLADPTGATSADVDALFAPLYQGAPANRPVAPQITPDRRTDTGTLIPSVFSEYETQTLDESDPAYISKAKRRQSVAAAFKESLATEERLKNLGIEVPPEGTEAFQPQGALKYFKLPLAALEQLQRGQYAIVGGLEGIFEGDPSKAMMNFGRGLLFAEPHSVHDILERYQVLQDSPVGNFIATLVGDVALDPLTWLTFGTNAFAKATAVGAKSAAELSPLLSKFGRKALKEAAATVPEHVAVQSIIDEIRKGTRLGRKLIPHGVQFAHWVPRIGDTRVADAFSMIDIIPGGVVQRINDLSSTQGILDSMTNIIVKSKLYDWFGEAFVPYWNIRKKFPILAEIERELSAKNHFRAQSLIERGRELMKALPRDADRELLTELLEKPWLITGKKFATIKRHVDGTPELSINTDYFPDGKKIGEDEAQELVDFFIDTYHRLKHSARTDLEQTRLGQGFSGAVYGGKDKFELLRPAFEALAAAEPNAKVYKINFGDFVMKFPGPAIVNLPTEQISNGAIQDLAAEMYVASKLAGSGLIPDTQVVWRKLGTINPEVSGTRLGNKVYTYKELLTKEGGDLSVFAWAHTQGMWDEYVRLTPEPERQFKTVLDLMKHMESLNPQIAYKNMYFPILVKRFSKGIPFDRAIDKIENFKKIDLDYTVDLIKAVQQLIIKSGRAGIEMGDLHGGNVFYNESGKFAEWIDQGRFVDWARGVGNGPQGFQGETVMPNYFENPELRYQGEFIPEGLEQAAKQKQIPLVGEIKGKPEIAELQKIALARVDVRGVNQPRPGTPLFEYMFPKIEVSPQNEAIRASLKQAFEDSVDGSLHSAMAPFGIISQAIGTTMEQIHALGASEEVTKKLFSELGTKLKDAGITTGHEIVKYQGEINARFHFKKGKSLAYEPIKIVKQAAVPPRDWEEVAETIVAQHPRIAQMNDAEKESILKAYGLARAWKDELEEVLRSKNLITQERMDAFKAKFGLEHVPHLKNANDPFTLFRALSAALKNKAKIGSLKGREIEGAIAEINAEFGTQFFEDDIAVILTKHAIDVSAASDSMDAINEAVRLFGKPVNFKNVKAKNGRIVPKAVPDPGFVTVDHPAVSGIQVPAEVAQWMTRFTKTFSSSDAGSKFWRNYDKALAVWKGYATFVNPGFHGRNFFANLFQIYLKNGPDAFNPLYHKYAVDILRGRDGSLELFNGTKVPYQEVMDYARRYGVYGTGWFGSDIKDVKDVASALKKVPRTKRLANPLSQGNVLFQAGKFAGGVVENEARMVSFVIDYVRTANPNFAAQNTKKFMFDYSEITEMDKWFKRAIPFWTWMKKNTTLQAEQIIKQPAKYGNVARFKEALEAQSPDTDERWLPKYFPELYAVKTPIKTKEGSTLYLNPNLPFQDLNKIFDPEDWLNSLGPWKAVFELSLNKQLFSKREIEGYSGELAPAPWFEIVPDHIMSKVGPTLGATKYYDPDAGTWLWGVPAKVKYAVEAANPFFRNFGKIAGTTTSQLPGYAKEKYPYDVMSWMTGVKLIPYNPTAEMEKHIFARRDLLRAKMKRAQAEGKAPSVYLPETH